jgi:protein ImuB
MASRIACLTVADFAVAAIARANPELRERAFALLRTASAIRTALRRPQASYQPHSELTQVSALAREGGVRPGMTVANARALMPELIVMNPSPAAERAAADALCDVAESLSPVIEEGAPGCVWLDLTGVERFFRHSIRTRDPQSYSYAEGGAEDEIAAELASRARRIGLEISVGIASGKEIAHMAAQCGGLRVIAPEREREFLNWMPLDLLGLEHEAQMPGLELTLKRLGIRRLGDLARLNSRAAISRLGPRGAELTRLARGECSPLIARRQAENFVEAVELEYGIEQLEALAFIMRGMLSRITERLAMRGLVAGDMMMVLGLAGHHNDSRRIAVGAPSNDVRSLLSLLSLNLEGSPPGAAVETVRLTVEPRASRPAQTDMFLPPSPAPERLETAIAKIAALCGPERIGMFTAADSWRPEAMRRGHFAPPSLTSEQSPNRANGGCIKMVIRAIRPAEELEVMCSRFMPEFIRGKTICARVITAAGPWRRQGEWWTSISSEENAVETNGGWNAAPAAYARDYYELALADGGVYRVYCDLYSGRWFADGLYD